MLGHYGVPRTKANSTEWERGENGDGNDERRGRREWGGHRGPETKMCLLVEDVSEYRDYYEGEGTD